MKPIRYVKDKRWVVTVGAVGAAATAGVQALNGIEDVPVWLPNVLSLTAAVATLLVQQARAWSKATRDTEVSEALHTPYVPTPPTSPEHARSQLLQPPQPPNDEGGDIRPRDVP